MSGPKHTPGVLSGPCPVCMGVGTEYDAMVPGGLLHCPDCAGTGKAKNSITVNENDAEAWRRHWMEAVALEHKAVKRGNRLAAALKDLLKLHDSGVFVADAWDAAMEDARAALREAGVDDA